MNNIAVVTPVYNTQDFLHRCIDSVLSQKGVSLQFFIIDDGSNDNSPSIASYYQRLDPRITFIRKTNAGQGPARNIGIKLAESEYVYFVDSDDYLGDDALITLYQTAQEKGLDICSPNVPRHYFEKPLEYISCLPCKSQFIKLRMLREFEILQPSIRSGQDGVFSHLALSHCTRIGMAANAVYNYTHAREGSTFAAHLKRHDLVPSLLKQHFEAIEEHYQRHNLWQKNALRLLNFIREESLRNRLEPHLPFLTRQQKATCFELLSRVAKKAYAYLSAEYRSNIGSQLEALVKLEGEQLVEIYEREWAGKAYKIQYSNNNNVESKDLIICKYSDSYFAPNKVSHQPENIVKISESLRSEEKTEWGSLKNEVRQLRGKLDLAVNSIINSSIQVTSAIYNRAVNLDETNSELVVSLTTLPSRLPLVHYAIESIFAQTMRPSRVVLWISDEIDIEMSATPQLKNLMARGLEIRAVEDVGPHTKLIYAIKEFKKECVVTIDDDIVYPINMLQTLWDQHLKYPSEVICNWARELKFDLAGKVCGVRDGRLLTPPILESQLEQAERFQGTPNILAFPYGTSGVLYPPDCFDGRVFDVKSFKQLCPKEDDIWFKAMSLLKGTRVVPTNLGINPSHHCITGSQAEALRHDNHGMQKNKIQMQAVFEHFRLYDVIKDMA